MAVSTLSIRDHLAKLSGRRLGAFKTAAKKAGITFEQYVQKLENGEKRCTACKQWRDRGDFNLDDTRWDGLFARCRECQSSLNKAAYDPAPVEDFRKHGPCRQAPDGTKEKARELINSDVSNGYRPHPSRLHCVMCGHKGKDRRHEYHHHRGYAPEHAYDVVPLCSTCHGIEHRTTHCKHGHEFTNENTIVVANGTRRCRECRRIYDRNRRDAAFWRQYRKCRKEGSQHGT